MEWATFEIAIVSLLAKSGTFAVALLAVYLMQVLYDRTNSVDQRKAFDLVESDPRAVADYFGWRILAFCILGGLVFS